MTLHLSGMSSKARGITPDLIEGAEMAMPQVLVQLGACKTARSADLAFYTEQLAAGHMWDKKVQELINAGITGEHFLGRIESETALGPYPAVSTSLAHCRSSAMGTRRNGCRRHTDIRMQEQTLSKVHAWCRSAGDNASSCAAVCCSATSGPPSSTG